MTFFQARRRRAAEARAEARRRRQAPALGLAGMIGLEPLERRLVLSGTSIWQGGTSAAWNDPTNWNGPPAPGNDLQFPSPLATSPTSTNNIGNGISYNSLTIGAAGYSIGGDSIALAGLLEASQSSGSSTVGMPIELDANPATVTVDNAGATLALTGAVTGTNGLNKTGAGELDLATDSTYSGATLVNGGTLRVDSKVLSSPITVNTGALLEGTGTVNAITATAGTVSPGDGGPGTLTDNGDASFQSGSTFAVSLNGATAGTGYNQLVVKGNVNLNGATLSGTLGYVPKTNDQYVIINNTGTNPVSGTFAGLAQGATVVIGGQPFQISYAGGDGNDVVLTHLVSSTTSLSPSTSTSVFGQTVTLTATVASGDPSDTNTPTGTVQFMDGGTTLGTGTLSGGVATLNTSSLVLGSNSITAQYSGDASFNSSTSSPATTITVSAADTTTSVTATPNPQRFGQQVTLQASVSANSPGGGAPTGTVQFFNGGHSLGTASLASGAAQLNVTSLPIGANSITAEFLGNTNYNASPMSSPFSETINLEGTTTALNVSPNPAGFGQSVTLTATVGAVDAGSPTPTGTVDFFNGSSLIGSGTLNVSGVATFSTSTLPQGTSSLKAEYLSDGNFATSTSPAVTTTVEQASTTTVNASSTSVTFGQQVMLTATVKAGTGSGTPAGNVNFLSGSTVIGSVALTGGTASFPTANLPIGSNSITVAYQGQSPFAASTSGPLTVTVAQATTTAVMSATPNPGGLGQLVTMTATISTNSTSTTKPTGVVQFFNGATSLGQATISGSTATLTTSALTLGANTLTAKYLGDGNYNGTTSPAFTETISQASTTTVSSSPSAAVVGQPVTLTANVQASNPGGATPTGSVNFFVGATTGTPVASGTLNGSGVATATVTNLPLGTDAVTAVYGGDKTYATSTSSATSVSVTQASSTATLTLSPNPSGFGQPVTLTATIKPKSPSTSGTPTGTVTFMSGSTSLGTGTLSNGVATLQTTSLTLGSNSLTAQYAGDTNFTASTSPAVTATVNQSNATVTVTLSKSNPVAFEAVVVTATVKGTNSTATPTGNVEFFANGKAIGSGTLSKGVATFITAKLPIGDDTITAAYSGDSNFGTAKSSAVTAAVGTDVERWINEIYIDALGRPVDQGGLDYWRTQLILGVAQKKVVHQIVSSGNAHEAVVQALYETYLRRPATTEEVVAALSPASINSGVGLSARLLGSTEYFNTQGGGKVQTWITALYLDVLDTAKIPASARAQITQELSHGVSRTTIAQQLLLTDRGREVIIDALYLRILNRSADKQGTNDMLGLMKNGGRFNQALTALLSSQEFRSKFNLPNT